MKKMEMFMVASFVCAPACAIITFFLFPFWKWFEATTKIESVGHFGISSWCFIAVYLILMVGFTIYRVVVSKPDNSVI